MNRASGAFLTALLVSVLVASLGVAPVDAQSTIKLGNLVDLVHENRTAFFELRHNVHIVHNLLTHVDGGAKAFERLFNRDDGAERRRVARIKRVLLDSVDEMRGAS